MSQYWTEFLLVAGVNFIAVVSPGPDFALVLRQSLVHGRRVATWSSLGIGTGIFVHVGYSLLGIGILIQSSETAFAALKWLGAAYLAWLAWHGLRARPNRNPEGEGDAPASGRLSGNVEPSSRQAFVTGFLTNALNPKATLFFVALFSVVINPHTPVFIQALYGVWMALVTAVWFCLVSVLFTRPEIRSLFRRQSHWIDRLMGVALLGFAVRLAFASVK